MTFSPEFVLRQCGKASLYIKRRIRRKSASDFRTFEPTLIPTSQISFIKGTSPINWCDVGRIILRHRPWSDGWNDPIHNQLLLGSYVIIISWISTLALLQQLGCTKKIDLCLRCCLLFSSSSPLVDQLSKVALSAKCFLVKPHSRPKERQWQTRRGIQRWYLLLMSHFTRRLPPCQVITSWRAHRWRVSLEWNVSLNKGTGESAGDRFQQSPTSLIVILHKKGHFIPSRRYRWDGDTLSFTPHQLISSPRMVHTMSLSLLKTSSSRVYHSCQALKTYSQPSAKLVRLHVTWRWPQDSSPPGYTNTSRSPNLDNCSCGVTSFVYFAAPNSGWSELFGGNILHSLLCSVITSQIHMKVIKPSTFMFWALLFRFHFPSRINLCIPLISGRAIVETQKRLKFGICLCFHRGRAGNLPSSCEKVLCGWF